MPFDRCSDNVTCQKAKLNEMILLLYHRKSKFIPEKYTGVKRQWIEARCVR